MGKLFLSVILLSCILMVLSGCGGGVGHVVDAPRSEWDHKDDIIYEANDRGSHIEDTLDDCRDPFLSVDLRPTIRECQSAKRELKRIQIQNIGENVVLIILFVAFGILIYYSHKLSRQDDEEKKKLT